MQLVLLFAQPSGRTFIYNDAYYPTMVYMGYLFKFVWVIILILAIIGGFTIYQKWQAGEDDISGRIFRWGGSLLTVLALTGFLSEFYIHSDNDDANNLSADAFNPDSKPAQIAPLTNRPVTTPTTSFTLPSVVYKPE